MIAEGPRRSLYGRRRGHRLHKTRQGLVDGLLPRLRIALPEAGPLDPIALFDFAPDALWLEIGFGGGEHLAAQARAHPRFGLIGCEPFINGVAGLLLQIDGLDNLRIHDDDARALLDRLPDASIDRVFLLFPDPWPKARHHKRRFVCRENLDSLARVMKDGAEFRFASDDASYVAWALDHLQNHPDFVWTARRPKDWQERPADWPQTRYEAKGLAQGRPPCFLRFLRRPRG